MRKLTYVSALSIAATVVNFHPDIVRRHHYTDLHDSTLIAMIKDVAHTMQIDLTPIRCKVGDSSCSIGDIWTHAILALDRRFITNQPDLAPSYEEKEFTIAHELTHLDAHHMLLSHLFTVGVVAHLIWFPGAIALRSAAFCGSIIGTRQLQELHADYNACAHGYAQGGIDTMERQIAQNKYFRKQLKTQWITKGGNYLLDIMHPPLTFRLQLIKWWSEETGKISS